MIFDIAKGAGMNLEKELHLLWAVNTFVDNLRASGEIQHW